MSKITSSTLLKYKQEGRKFTALTAYDASFAGAFDSEGVDVLLVGDSLGMVLQGHDDTLPVTTAEIAYHTRCVRRGIERALLIADMPFMSYATPEQAMINATELMQAGANMVKVEGGHWLLETVTKLTERGIPVCAHLGLTPQSVHVFGGFKVQGRDAENAQRILDEAKALESRRRPITRRRMYSSTISHSDHPSPNHSSHWNWCWSIDRWSDFSDA